MEDEDLDHRGGDEEDEEEDEDGFFLTCVLQSGQQDGALAALVPVPHPVQSKVRPEPCLLSRPPRGEQLLQHLLTHSCLPSQHLNTSEGIQQVFKF